MSTAAIFYGAGSITQIDYATIDCDGFVVGGSTAPSMIISGPVEEQEQVVIDFSTCKKSLKAIIDDKETGIDHKLVIGPWSNCQVTNKGNMCFIETPHWNLNLPKNAVHITDIGHEHDIHNHFTMAVAVKALVLPKMRALYSNDIDVVVRTTPQFQLLPDTSHYSVFRYTHGLKSSTSWGCQNICHGHLSYISLKGDDLNCRMLEQFIASKLDMKMFVWAENLSTPNTINYCTERGNFSATAVSDEAQDQIVVVDTETTVENLVNYVVSKFSLRENGVEEIYLSEGLSKGSFLDLL